MADHKHDEYFAIRAEQERAAADRTADPTVRRIHLELAQRYAAKTTAQIAA